MMPANIEPIKATTKIKITDVFRDLKAFRSLNTSVILILVVALIGSILAGIIAGNYTRENFLELERAVSRLESGDLKKKTIKSLPTKRVDEIGSVARSLSSISVDLKNQMTLLANNVI